MSHGLPRRSLLHLLTVFAMALGVTAFADPGRGATEEPASAPDQLLIGYEVGASPNERAQARAGANARFLETVVDGDSDTAEVELVQVRASERSRAEHRFEADPNVTYAEPNWILTHQATSTDPYYTNGSLWGMYGDASSPANRWGSQAAEAWGPAAGSNIGSANVWVGIIDTGYQHTHPDLDGNVGTNPGEIAGNGVDDDDNGYVDDVHGWDFHYGNNTVYDNNKDDHGTHVAGTIGAEANGVGVVGVNWSVKMMNGKFLGPNGGYTSNAVKAVDYFTDLKTRHGIDLVATSNSWGGGGYSSTLHAAINRAANADILFIAAAGNNGVEVKGDRYPCSYDTRTATAVEAAASYDAVVCVAAIDRNGNLASWSNWSKTHVDLAAPGVGIYSTVPTDGYASYSGTSMATPHVSGGSALYRAANPQATASDIRNAILASTIPTDSVVSKTTTGGRLDLSGFLASSTAPTTGTVSGRVTDGSTTDPVEGATVSLDGTTATTTTSADGSYELEAAGAPYTLRVTATGYDTATTSVTITNGGTATKDVALSPSSPQPTTGKVSGRVMDGSTTDPVEGATVSLDGTTATTTTSADGTYELDAAGGPYTLRVTATGYDTATTSVSIANGETSNADVSLTPSAPATVETMSAEANYAPGGGGRNGDKHLTVTITVRSPAGPISGASVSVSISNGATTWAGSGTTGSSGTTTFTITNAPDGCYRTTVTSLTAEGHLWDGTQPTTTYQRPGGTTGC